MNDLTIALTAIRRHYKCKVLLSTDNPRQLYLVSAEGNHVELKRSDVEYWSRYAASVIFGEIYD
jgi:hypothetical protein